MKREKIIGAAIVLIVVLGFLRCIDGLWVDGDNGWGGTGGFAGGVGGSAGTGEDGGVGGVAGTGGTGGLGGSSGNGGTGGPSGFVCGDAICAEGEDLATCAADCDHDLVVVVERALAGTLADSLNTYVEDLRVRGKRVRIEAWEPGTVQELKAVLFDQVDRYGTEGALLVGNLPAAFYEHAVICIAWDRIDRCVMYEYEEFPTDVYLQDRNASWIDSDGDGKYDSHDELHLEIFVSRLQTLPEKQKCEKSELFPECPESYEPGEAFYASEECVLKCPSRLRMQIWQEYELGDVECCGPHFLRRYFEHDHRYRSEGPLLDRSAMIFIDDDFVQMALPPTGLVTLYRDVKVLTDEAETTREAYLDRLLGSGAEFVHHYTHSTVQNLYFYVCANWDTLQDPPECLDWNASRLFRTEISSGPFEPSYNLRVSFANMYNCHASRFTEPNLGMAFTVQTDYGLATVGNTRKGGMTDATLFHEALAQGLSWGESYRRWYNEVGRLDDRWFLGVVLTGDPLLTIPLEPGVLKIREDELVDVRSKPVETSAEITASDPPGTFEDYKRRNPQFFDD